MQESSQVIQIDHESLQVNEPATPPHQAVEQDQSKPNRRIIALMNQKGGVGKTTTAVNVGAALALKGHKCLLIDLDPQAHLSLSLGIDPEVLDASMYQLLADSDTSAEQIVQYIDEARNLAVLPAEVNLAGVEAELADRVVTGTAQTTLRSKCQNLVDQFDYTIIDCPPSLGLLTINALTLAREVIVPMQAHFLALQGLSKLLETVQMVRRAINPQLIVSGVMLCMYEGQTILANEVTADLKNFFDQSRDTDVPWNQATVLQPPIRRNIKLAESPSFGKSIFHYAPDSHGALDYHKLAQAIVSHHVAAMT